MTSSYEALYKDVPALALETRELRALVLPEHGGKLASLVLRKTGREVLAQALGETYKPLAYDGRYVDAECSGLDDMLPTIDQCIYEGYPWSGTRLPDHGEVAGLSWEKIHQDEAWVLRVHGVRLPYVLEKRIAFEGEKTLRMDYRLKNLSGLDMDFLWAAHAMFAAEEGGEIRLPYPEGSPAACVFSRDGRYMDRWTWPVAQTSAGSKVLNRTGPCAPDGDNFKFYFMDRPSSGRFEYRYPSDGTILTMEVPVESVPYFSVWVNEGSFHQMHTFAFEPCTGAFDRPDLARLHRMHSVLNAGGEYQWYLKLRLETSGD